MTRVFVERDLDKAVALIYEFIDRTGLQVNPFMRPAWLATWVEYNSPTGRPEVFFFEEADSIVGYVPLCAQKNFLGTEIYSFLGEGDTNLAEIVGVVPVQTLFTALIQHFESRRNEVILRLKDVEDRSDLGQHLRSENVNCVTQYLYLCPFVDLSPGWESYYRTKLNSKRRNEFAKYERRLRTLGDVSVKTITSLDEYNANRHLLENLYEIHAKRFAHVLNTSGFSDPKNREFFDNLMYYAAAEGSLFLSIMSIDQTVVSFVLGFIYGDRIIDSIPAFEPALAPFTLGHLHLKSILQDLAGKGVRVFDFSKGSSVYKEKWATGHTENMCFWIPINLAVRGKLSFKLSVGVDELKNRLRKRGITEKVKRLVGQMYFYTRGSVHLYKRPDSALPTPKKVYSNGSLSYEVIRNLPSDTRSRVIAAVAKGAVLSIQDNKIVVEFKAGETSQVVIVSSID